MAVGEGKEGLFFALAGYTKEAVIWADRVGLKLYTFDLQGVPVPANLVAQKPTGKPPAKTSIRRERPDAG